MPAAPQRRHQRPGRVENALRSGNTATPAKEKAAEMSESGYAGTIDCDIHFEIPSVDVLVPFLDAYWQSYIRETSFKGPVDTSYPKGSGLCPAPRDGAGEVAPEEGLDHLRAHVLDRHQTRIGILTCAYAIESIRNPFAAAALARAVNDWQITHWLEPEPRLRGSVMVPSQDPDLAAKEVDRVGGHPGFVQVFLPVHSESLYGHRRYYPVYEAALRSDLAVGIHAGGNPGNPPSAVGWPSYFIEEYVGMAHIFQSQVISLVVDGVFDRFPDLRVALLESGVTWLPSLMWRLDKEWKGLRREVPWVRRLPSDYIRHHIRLTTEPFDAPRENALLPEIIDQVGSEDLLMFATDYPHQHSTRSSDDLLESLAPDLQRKLRHENAATFYRIAQ
jgi:predicted TIM-barrel fold metal-dependent hydrolase